VPGWRSSRRERIKTSPSLRRPTRPKPNNADTRGNLKPVLLVVAEEKVGAGEFSPKHGRSIGTQKVIITDQKHGERIPINMRMAGAIEWEAFKSRDRASAATTTAPRPPKA